VSRATDATRHSPPSKPRVKGINNQEARAHSQGFGTSGPEHYSPVFKDRLEELSEQGYEERNSSVGISVEEDSGEVFNPHVEDGAQRADGNGAEEAENEEDQIKHQGNRRAGQESDGEEGADGDETAVYEEATAVDAEEESSEEEDEEEEEEDDHQAGVNMIDDRDGNTAHDEVLPDIQSLLLDASGPRCKCGK
jgi:hypothetical protein